MAGGRAGRRRLLVLFCLCMVALGRGHEPIIIGHRGSCGMFPEHTLEGYRQAILQGANFIECDVVMTKDGVPICRHEPNIIETTDVLTRPEFSSRRRNVTIDRQKMDGFFTVDFTLAEIKQLRAVQRLKFRDPSYDGLFEVPTLAEYLAVAKSPEWNRTVGIYPETKHPSWHESLGLKLEDKILEALQSAEFSDKGAVFLQSFEPRSLRYLRNRSDWKLVQLLEDDWERPTCTFPIIDDGKVHPTGELLDEIATWADAIGPSKESIVPMDPISMKLSPPTELLELAHARALEVHAYTFRNEYIFLAFDYGQDPYSEYKLFVDDLKIDGLFSDFPATASRFLKTRLCEGHASKHTIGVAAFEASAGEGGMMRFVGFLMTAILAGVWATVYLLQAVFISVSRRNGWQELGKVNQTAEQSIA